MKNTKLSLVLAGMLALSTSSFADAQTDKLSQQLADMTKRLNTMETQSTQTAEKTDLLMEETADLKTGFGFGTLDLTQSRNGKGPAASKVYFSKSPLSIGGYGEMFFAAPDQGKGNFADVYRFIPYIGYRFSDNIILNVEIEIEHGGSPRAKKSNSAGNKGKAGKIIIEFMYLDFRISDALNIQVGNLLVPMGLTNLRHEPTLFNTVQRPETERQIIPSTWHENGIMTYGDIGDSGFRYNLGFINALDYEAKGFDSSDGTTPNQGTTSTRNARIGSSYQGMMESIAGIARLDYENDGLLVGGSMYYASSADQARTEGSSAFLYEVHVAYSKAGFALRALYAANQVDGIENPGAITSSSGHFVNLEYNVIETFDYDFTVPVFVQYDSFNNAEELVDGSDPQAGITITTVGINYFPHPQTVLKLDYAMRDYDKASKQDFNTLSASIGFIF